MRFVTGRTGRDWLRPAVFCILALFLLGAGASASGQGAEEAAIRAALESYLRAYQEKAMLYEDRDLRAGTVIDPDLHMPPGSGDAVFRFSGKDVTLSRLQSDMAYLEQKAAFYAGMRQMQEIYRENLRLTYALEELEREGSACRVSVKETAAFRYMDSEIPSVCETGYSVRLVRLGDRWLVAGAGSGSLFDKTYQESGLDADAALAAFAKELETEDCRLSFPAGDSGGNRIAYRGADAAAYAYTYSRREADMPRDAFYNPFFFGYAGEGGDCQNFASQCIWAGFGGSEEAGAIRGQTLPMDPAGENRWFGRPASGGSYTNSWLSCQSFRQYLTGSRDASGRGGSNGGSDTGIYASVLDVGAGSPLSAVTPEELVGAAAHGGRRALRPRHRPHRRRRNPPQRDLVLQPHQRHDPCEAGGLLHRAHQGLHPPVFPDRRTGEPSLAGAAQAGGGRRDRGPHRPIRDGPQPDARLRHRTRRPDGGGGL